ncbi:SlyX family protein [Amphritea balenae]|uniref:Protein SlyX homolog n=1 Tax=Amphritea balenae TaxID=452629 RepID=A0A3P1SM62_9GAMM|nr:SlyX family protein [Amphritea balenae]RRC98333.1 SlyX family protein [Amphritea balenae]GGK81045.1 protein SlyX [Amphritea balenae]
MNQQQKIDDLESRIAFQEDAIDKMSQEMATQGAELERLSQIVKILNQQIKQVAPENINAPEDEAPPPHY